MEATVVDLQYHMNEVLKALDRNESVNVLYHGRIKGIIRPTGRSKSAGWPIMASLARKCLNGRLNKSWENFVEPATVLFDTDLHLGAERQHQGGAPDRKRGRTAAVSADVSGASSVCRESLAARADEVFFEDLWLCHTGSYGEYWAQSGRVH